MLKYILALFFLYTCVFAFSPRDLLGPKECSLGPKFWCKNITNAKSCNAVKHCIQTVWEHQIPLLDDEDDDVCTLCKAMVNDARNQLDSNETLDMIKDVFQRSCKLILFKPVVKECIKFADEYAEELVDMLSSYMSPDMICTLAGLCSSSQLNKMYEDLNNKNLRERQRNAELQKDCESCMDLAEYIQREIELATPDDVKSYFKDRCNYAGSFSLACTNLIDDIIPVMYTRIADDYTPASFCYLTSACINGYGRRVQVKTESDSGVIHVNPDAISLAMKHLSDEQTCQICKTMVRHLKDILVSNTTETEFKQMVIGMCRQVGRFRSECVSLAEEYYDEVYHYLVNDFNETAICLFVDLCDPPEFIEGLVTSVPTEAPYPVEDVRFGSVSIAKSDSGVQIITPASHKPVKVEISYGDPLESKYQLPLERMAVPQVHDIKVNSRKSCMICQYLLHYIQKVISQPYGEDAVKEIVNKVCDEFPQSITLQCKNFVQEFGDAFVAILAQEIDPSQVCPAVRACPSEIVKDKYVPLEVGGAPGCPLCLMVVEDITEKLKDNKTEDAIRKTLHSLCERMPENLRPQCNEFVQKYTEEVVDMMLADFTPQEVCTHLKLCHTKVDVELVAPHSEEKHEILTNEIPQGEKEGERGRELEVKVKAKAKEEVKVEAKPKEEVKVEAKPKEETKVEAVEKKNNQPLCFLCEFVMDKVKDQLNDNKSEEEVRRAVLGACDNIPKAIERDCRDFVKNYSKYIVEMLENNVDPRMVCREMHMCKEEEAPANLDHVLRAVEECAICEALVGAIRGLLEDKNFDRNMSRYAAEICYSMPFLRPYQMDRCRSLVLSYGPSIINLLVQFEVRPELVCSRLELCDKTEQAKVHLIETSTEVPKSQPQQRPHLIGGNSCTWGPSYWCQSEDHAKECGTLAHCREVVWKADRPTPAA